MPDISTTYKYLEKLRENNNREWFTKHKAEYESALESVISFADQLLSEMQKHDNIETASGKKSLYRIYRDIRFSKDKTPYKTFKKHFDSLVGEAVKTAPKGFDKEHPAIDLIRYKQYILTHNFKDKEVFEKDFHKKVSKTFTHMRPFMDYMSDILTTDLNGVPLV